LISQRKPFVIRSIRYENKIIGKGFFESKQGTCEIDPPYPAQFSGYNDVTLDKNKDNLIVEELITTTSPPTFNKKGTIRLSRFSLETICPKTNDAPPEEIVLFSESQELAENDEEELDGDLSDEKESSNDSFGSNGDLSDEKESPDDGDDSADSDYHELTWKEIIDKSPDKFTYKGGTVAFKIKCNRTDPNEPYLMLVGLTVWLDSKRDISPVRRRQSVDGKTTRKNE